MVNELKKETFVSIVIDALSEIKYVSEKAMPSLNNNDKSYGNPKFITPRGSFFKHSSLEKNVDFKSL